MYVQMIPKSADFLFCQSNLGDTQYLYIDLAITTTVAILMGWTGAHTELVAQRPRGSLTSGPNLFSIFSQIFVTTAVQVRAARDILLPIF
jgi:magnesium-transporting ATPase (P-type)